MSVFKRFKTLNIFSRIKNRLLNRRGIPKPRYLSRGYHDTLDVLPHMMFELLSVFVEEELCHNSIEWYGDDGPLINIDGTGVYVRDEIQCLYTWWNDYYNHSRLDEYEVVYGELERCQPTMKRVLYPDIPGTTTTDFIFDTDEQEVYYTKCLETLYTMEDEDEMILQANLHRLVNLRRYLWT